MKFTLLMSVLIVVSICHETLGFAKITGCHNFKLTYSQMESCNWYDCDGRTNIEVQTCKQLQQHVHCDKYTQDKVIAISGDNRSEYPGCCHLYKCVDKIQKNYQSNPNNLEYNNHPSILKNSKNYDTKFKNYNPSILQMYNIKYDSNKQNRQSNNINYKNLQKTTKDHGYNQNYQSNYINPILGKQYGQTSKHNNQNRRRHYYRSLSV